MLTIVLGVTSLVAGLVLWGGQLISVANFPLAQRLGLQERDDATDPLYRRLELQTARWDVAVLWTLVAAGGLLLASHGWWPWVALVAGGVSVDTAGRELVKLGGLRHESVRMGSPRERRTYAATMAILAVIGLGLIVAGGVSIL